jgi:CTP synthase (UTP-ammonia lyase)
VVGRTTLVECVELAPSLHPWFVGTQAHPEFKSRPNRPSPLYRDFIGASLGALLGARERDAVDSPRAVS